MSIDIHYAKHRPLQSSPSVIKSESQMIVERESFRQIFHDDKDQELILQIYELLRCVRDLEHPYTLEQLDAVNPKDIEVKQKNCRKYITIWWKPSSPTCPYALQTGLSIIMKLQRELTDFDKMKIRFEIKPDSHKQKKIIDKQLNDKERVIAAQENDTLRDLLESLIS